MSPLTELLAYLAGFAARCRAARWLGALFHVGVMQQIAADVVDSQKQIGLETSQAAVEDGKAAQLLRQVLADGKITISETPMLRRALRHVERSAAHAEEATTMVNHSHSPA